MAIKMRVNKNKASVCIECGTEWINTREMYDILFDVSTYQMTLCYSCIDRLFKKSLRADCIYNAKVKSKEDFERLENERKNNFKT